MIVSGRNNVKEILKNRGNADSPTHPKRAAQNTICVLGGDGTMNEVANALYKSGNGLDTYALAYLPTGSSNDLARALHITPSYSEFIDRIKKGTEARFSMLWNRDKEIERLKKNIGANTEDTEETEDQSESQSL